MSRRCTSKSNKCLCLGFVILKNTRSHYRIPYPMALRPSVKCPLGKFSVVDVSEEGLKFEVHFGHKFQKGEPFEGKVTFHDGESFTVKGKVLRTQEMLVIVQLSEGIPLKKIMSEQRFLLQNFPDSLKGQK